MMYNLVINRYIHLKGEYMTKAQEIAELEQRLGREIALEYFKNEKRVVSEEQAELEDYADPRFASDITGSTIL